MTSEVRYVFGDLLTNEVIEEIACSGVTVSDSLSGGEFRATFNLDQTGKSNEDLVAATMPGKAFAVVEREGVPIWGGIVWSRTYQSQAKVMQVYCKSMDQYGSKRFIEDDITFTATEQRNIFRTLYQNMQADPNSVQIQLPGVFPTVAPIDLTVAGSELRTYKEIFDQITTAEGGFEWRINVGRVSSQYTWTLQIGYPTIGQPLLDSSVVFEYPGSILNYWQNDTIGGAGTNIWGVGAGEGDAMLQVEVVHSQLLAAGFPRYDQDISLKNIDDENQLEATTQAQAQILKAPMPVYTVELKADREPKFGEWALGDYCKLVFKDPLHPNGLNHPSRILQWDWTPPSADSDEEVRLTFEGEDADS
jgi:hypothetical protein